MVDKGEKMSIDTNEDITAADVLEMSLHDISDLLEDGGFSRLSLDGTNRNGDRVVLSVELRVKDGEF